LKGQDLVIHETAYCGMGYHDHVLVGQDIRRGGKERAAQLLWQTVRISVPRLHEFLLPLLYLLSYSMIDRPNPISSLTHTHVVMSNQRTYTILSAADNNTAVPYTVRYWTDI
jgi:hypothetical protein